MSRILWPDNPAWLTKQGYASHSLEAPEDRVRLAIELSACNVRERTGGPFGAVIYDLDRGLLVSVGVNRVIPGTCALAHAETSALLAAQNTLETHDLRAVGRFELASSCAPCLMCLGALLWSGISQLSYGATPADAEVLGFDEGPRPAQWQAQLRARDIAIYPDRHRSDAIAVLRGYADAEGAIY